MDGIQLNEFVKTWLVKSGERKYLCLYCRSKDSILGDTAEEFKVHLSSWEHRIRVRQMEAKCCKLCDLQFRYLSHYNAHLKTKGHALKANPELKSEIKCDACQFKFRTPAEYKRHIASARHKKTVNPPKSSTFCEICDKDYKFASNMKVHLETAKHKRNLAKTDSLVPTAEVSAPNT